MGDDDAETYLSGVQLCQYLDVAEKKVRPALHKDHLTHNIQKRKQSEIPSDEVQSSDEAKYARQEERAAKNEVHDCG